MSNDSKSRRNTVVGIIILVLTAMIWGFAFVAQKYSTGHIDAVSMSGLRYVIATIILGITVLVTDLVNKHKGRPVSKFTKDTLIGGVICGVVLFVSTILQQIGIESTTSGKAGFITTLYIVMVPIINLMARKRTSRLHCFAVYIAVVSNWNKTANGNDSDKADSGVTPWLFKVIAIIVPTIPGPN